MAADADEKRIEYLENALRELRDNIGTGWSDAHLREFADRALNGEEDPHPKVEANDEMIARLQKEADE